MADIFIQIHVGITFRLNVQLDDTIQHLKHKIQKQKSIPVHRQRLIYQGKELTTGRVLSHVYIGAVIHLVRLPIFKIFAKILGPNVIVGPLFVRTYINTVADVSRMMSDIA
eukprot:109833_1